MPYVVLTKILLSPVPFRRICRPGRQLPGTLTESVQSHDRYDIAKAIAI